MMRPILAVLFFLAMSAILIIATERIFGGHVVLRDVLCAIVAFVVTMLPWVIIRRRLRGL